MVLGCICSWIWIHINMKWIRNTGIIWHFIIQSWSPGFQGDNISLNPGTAGRCWKWEISSNFTQYRSFQSCSTAYLGAKTLNWLGPLVCSIKYTVMLKALVWILYSYNTVSMYLDRGCEWWLWHYWGRRRDQDEDQVPITNRFLLKFMLNNLIERIIHAFFPFQSPFFYFHESRTNWIRNHNLRKYILPYFYNLKLRNLYSISEL